MHRRVAGQAWTPSRLAVVVAGAVALAGSAAAHPTHHQRFGAWFEERSYVPGGDAVLLVHTRAARVRAQVVRIGAGPRLPGTSRLTALPVGAEVDLRLGSSARGVSRARLPIGPWESGLYFLRVSLAGRVRYAPFIVRPRRLGRTRVAVVLPTNTWQAYNRLDEDGDGVGDTWYADWKRDTVSLSRPFRGRGIPPFFASYDDGFLRYLHRRDRAVDMLADDDLTRVGSGAQLARLYDLIVFPGHEEYVTRHAYDVVEGFRNRGGNLMFLSANNFFSRVSIRHGTMRRVGRWRDLGRPEAGLVGVQYVDWSEKRPLAPLVVRGANRAPWLFAGAGMRDGFRFGHFGIEIDARAKASPAATITVARIPHAFGRRLAAEMTYYETEAGARVFAAGVMNFGGSASNPVVERMLDNLWARLGPGDPRPT